MAPASRSSVSCHLRVQGAENCPEKVVFWTPGHSQTPPGHCPKSGMRVREFEDLSWKGSEDVRIAGLESKATEAYANRKLRLCSAAGALPGAEELPARTGANSRLSWSFSLLRLSCFTAYSSCAPPWHPASLAPRVCTTLQRQACLHDVPLFTACPRILRESFGV